MKSSRRGSIRSVNQPDAVVPTRSNMPMTASRPAARTAGRPISPQKLIRCVPTRPLVVSPQMKKVANNSQKARVRAARPSATKASRTLSRAGRPGAGATTSAAPNGGSPRSDGRSAMMSATIGTITPQTTETAIATGRAQQPHDQTAVADEPPVRHRCPQDGRHSAGSNAGEDAPGRDILPGFAHAQAERCGAAHERKSRHHGALDAKRLHEGRGKGPDEAVEEDSNSRGQRNLAARPAEGALQRGHQHARRGAKTS